MNIACGHLILEFSNLFFVENFSDVAFLERNLDKDSDIMKKSIEGLSDYPDPVWLLIFAEGTRMNPEKLEASRDFARSRNLPVLRHCK